MSVAAYQKVWRMSLTGSKLNVMLCLAEHHNSKTGRCNPSYERIANMTGLSRRHVVRLINGLVDDDRVLSASKSAGFHSNNYKILNRDIAMSPSDDAQTVTFDAQTVTFDAQTVTFDAPNSDIAMSPEPGTGKNRKNREGENTPPVDNNKKSETRKPAAIHLLQKITGLTPPRGIFDIVDETVGDQPGELQRFENVIKRWLLAGYNPKNVGGMLDYFNRRELPGEANKNGTSRTGNRKQKTSSPATPKAECQKPVTVRRRRGSGVSI